MFKRIHLLLTPSVLVSFWLIYCLVLLAWYSYRHALKAWLCLN